MQLHPQLHGGGLGGARSAAVPQVGDRVVARDGEVGRIDRVVRSEARDPLYIVVAVGHLFSRRYPIAPWSLVTHVDRARRQIHIRGRRRSVERLPETLPITI
jgi:hypothetical protein